MGYSLRDVLRPTVAFVVASLPSCFATATDFVGNYESHTIGGQLIVFDCGQPQVSVQVCTDQIVQVTLHPFHTLRFDSSFVVIQKSWPNVTFTVEETDSTVAIVTSALHILCTKRPFRIQFYDASGRLILRERLAGGLGWEGPKRFAYFHIEGDEHFYGLGERALPLDRKGYAFDTYNRHIGGYRGETPTMSISIPFLSSPRGYGLFFDTTYPGYFDLGKTRFDEFYYRADGGEMTYYFIYGPSLKDVLASYTWLTGRQPLPPRWALGYQQSKFGYRNEAEARETVRLLRQKRIPCDVLILDLYWYGEPGDMGRFAWDYTHWPNPTQMIADFRNQGIRTVLIEEPYFTTSTANYSEAASRGYLGKTAAGTAYPFQMWAGYAGLLDFTNPAASEWWWQKHKPFIDQGIAGWWIDLGEPETHPRDMVHYLGPSDKVHNIFNLLWSQTLFDGYVSYRPNERVYILSRSGYAGMQRNGVVPWSGDVSRSFGGLAVQIPMLQGMGMSGVAYHNSDIGGFASGTTTPELYARWMQYGTFCPITRAHGVGQDTEPWTFGPVVEDISRKYIQLRYRLLPYIYTYAHENSETGLPLARPIILEYPNDPQAATISDEYLWGEYLLVAPMTEQGAISRSVYLPKGEWPDGQPQGWVNYWTDEIVAGGKTITVSAPLDILPLFAKRGSIIPMQNVMDYTTQFPLDTLTLDIFPGKTAEFEMYEDDGITNDYRHGTFALTKFTCDVTAERTTIDIGMTRGSYNGLPARRLYFAQVHHVVDAPDSVMKNALKLPRFETEAQGLTAEEGWWYDPAKRVTKIKVRTQPTMDYSLVLWGAKVLSVTGDDDSVPRRFHLFQNYPNPFNATTLIEFEADKRSRSGLQLRVYNVEGQLVADLTRQIQWLDGRGSIKFDAAAIPSGVYLYQLRIGEESQTRKMLVIR